MEKCIKDFITSIERIDDEYINVVGLDNQDENYVQAAEGAFTAELYHQWKTHIKNDYTNYYDDLQIHYDLSKQRFGGKRPDLVLHHSPNTRNDQRLYIEIKTSFNVQNYKADLEKIFLALGTDKKPEHLEYKNAIFFTTKAELTNVERTIKEYVNANQQQNNQKLENAFSIHMITKNNIRTKTFKEICK